MDELAKTEARNYLSAAGFFLIAASFLLSLFTKIGSNTYIEINDSIHLVIGIGLVVIATLLVVLRKRDMIGILFFMIGFLNLFYAFTPNGIWGFILTGFLVLVSLVTLTSKENVKWLLFIIPLIMFVHNLIAGCIGYNATLFIVFDIVLAASSLYYAFACASERFGLPGRKLLTADEATDFKASGSVLGYMLFALHCGLFLTFYIFELTAIQYSALLAWGLGNLGFPIATLNTLVLVSSALLIFVAILLLTIGRMRFTPIMFLLLGLASILSVYASGMMFIGLGILFIIIGLYAMLRKESRILPGIMIIVYGCTGFISALAGSLAIAPVASIILNAIPCLIAIYLSFVVYSQRKLPKF